MIHMSALSSLTTKLISLIENEKVANVPRKGLKVLQKAWKAITKITLKNYNKVWLPGSKTQRKEGGARFLHSTLV